ncbi:transcriptional regulator FtrA [Citrobacter sp. JGM124]|uniref:transcriptional regulator FtrA n=1 Tax=Citrobacter sp. JGM124 TaxID=2799789 RepID=UPI001BAD28AA|nr:transcriptional regulator FtrA [Citrobacter sp. JGM124]MBS0847301.1 transcriptional regulator FtrA [Citrobacter sp. JGM124]
MTKTSRNVENSLVVALAYDGLCTFEFSIAVEIFGLPRPEMGDNWYRFLVAAIEDGPIRATGGIRMVVDGELSLLEQAGTIIVPGWRHIDAPVPKTLCSALQAAHQRGARILSICSGVFVLAAAGLLQGKQSTTHWRYTAALAERYPETKVIPDVLYIDNGNILTSAGSAAGIDLCLYLVRRDFGATIANQVARRLVTPPHRQGGQTQIIECALPTEYESERFAPLFDYLHNHLEQPHTLGSMASHVGMSERTFLRRFEAATGTTPARWLLQSRLQKCIDFLENSHFSIDIIAEKTGFSSAANLRHHFRKNLLNAPQKYRKSFTLKKH